ncbi:MAG: family 43 glycosylhydrolase [Bacteroidaceae bacterium]|nr:family 43 glycosylhydrolase [Bacteroidaceae bacterium]
MKRKALFLLLSVVSLTLLAQTLTFQNPIVNQNGPDPSVMRDKDGTFYMFTTGNHIFRSPNMVDWTYLGECFTPEGRPTFVPGVKYLWAPDINRIGKQYVLYYAMSKWGGEDSCGVGVAYADCIEGPYTCINGNGKLFRSFEIGVRNSIDPFYIKDRGKHWLVWGSFHGIYAIELTRDGLAVKPGAEKVKIAGSAYEGAYIYKRKGYYYFFGSTGSCCDGERSTYRTCVARSKRLLGPYVDKEGRPLLENNHEVILHSNARWAGTGHNGEIIVDDAGQTWLPYHAYDKLEPEKGRKVLLDRIQWDEDGWPYIDYDMPATVSPRPVVK